MGVIGGAIDVMDFVINSSDKSTISNSMPVIESSPLFFQHRDE